MVRPLTIKQHRRGKRNSLALFTHDFKWVGNNINGAKSKWASVKRWVRVKKPSILSLQETKFQVMGKHKLDGYITFEHLRSEKTAGGGIFMAVMKELNPALARDGGAEVEALTVDIHVKKMKISCITAYGPQEKDSREKKENFWQFLDEEALRAHNEGNGVIIQGDLDAWLGEGLIPLDKRRQNVNGKLMEEFLNRNNLTVVNGLSICKGLFTRIQNRNGRVEKSVLDFFVVCNKILSYITSMEVDDMKQNIATNYTQVRKGGKSVDSDHVPIEMSLNLKIFPTRVTREIIYNFKNTQGRETLKNLTSETNQILA